MLSTFMSAKKGRGGGEGRGELETRQTRKDKQSQNKTRQDKTRQGRQDKTWDEKKTRQDKEKNFCSTDVRIFLFYWRQIFFLPNRNWYLSAHPKKQVSHGQFPGGKGLAGKKCLPPPLPFSQISSLVVASWRVDSEIDFRLGESLVFFSTFFIFFNQSSYIGTHPLRYVIGIKIIVPITCEKSLRLMVHISKTLT